MIHAKVPTTIGIAAAILLLALAASAQQPDEAWERIGLLPGYVTALAVSPNYEDDAILYAGVEEGGLWRGHREGGGTEVTFSWTRLESIPATTTVTALALRQDYAFEAGKPLFAGTREGLVYGSTNDFDSVLNIQALDDGQGNPVEVTCLEAWGTTTTYAFIGTAGGGIYRNTNLLATSPTKVTDNDMSDCRCMDRLGNTIYAVVYYLGNARTWERDGEADPTSWIERLSPLVGAVPTSLAVVAPAANTHAFLGTKNRGIWGTANLAGGANWLAACDGSATDVPFEVGAVATCPNYASDHEVWEGRSDGLRVSTDYAINCAAQNPFAHVTELAFSPGYHGTSPNYCDAFVGTASGLFLVSCEAFASGRSNDGPPSVPIRDVALAAGGPPGTWAASPLGLFRNVQGTDFLRYNAFFGEVPDVTAVALHPAFDAEGTCKTGETTLFIARRTEGIFQSADRGNTWEQVDDSGTPTWPGGVEVNHFAVSPSYELDSTIFAATTGGLFRWDGIEWQNAVSNPDGLVSNVVRVALSPTFQMTGSGTIPEWVVAFIVSDTSNNGLWYSPNGGATSRRFLNAQVQQADLTAVAFSPTYDGTSDRFLFAARDGAGAFFTSYFGAQIDSSTSGWNAPWCPFNTGVNITIRDLDTCPRNIPMILMSAATLGGAYFCSFDRDNDSSTCSGHAYTWSACGGFPPPSGSMDTTSVSYGSGNYGQYAAVGTTEDGVLFSTDWGQNFTTEGTGYTSLPDDIRATVPHPDDDAILFASSPTSGVFVSTDRGASFWPWNEVGTGTAWCMEGASGFGVVPSRGCSDPDIDMAWVGSPDPSADNQGVKRRMFRYDSSSGAYEFDYANWQLTNILTGSFERIETFGPGETSPVWAVSSDTSQGFYLNEGCNGAVWNQQGTGLGAGSPTDVRFGDDTTKKPGPDPDAPSASASWGTVSGSGVYRGVSSKRNLPGATAVTWEPRNGAEWGTLGNFDTLSVLQLSNGDLLAGCDGDLYLSPYPDEGQTTWIEIESCIAGAPSWQVSDFLESPEGDILMAMEGSSGSGGAWLSGNGGTCWMRISEGFDGSSQALQDLVNDTGSADGTVQYYGSTDGTGLYTRTITPDPPPAVTGLSASAGPASGGTSLTVSGSGFANSCVTDNSLDCPVEVPVVMFGGVPVNATYVGETQLTVVTPPHDPGTVEITVMNPDTRTGTCACTFEFTADGTGGTAGGSLRLSQGGGLNILDWEDAGLVTVQRSTSPLFDTGLRNTETFGATWTDPDPGVGTDGTLYFYRVQSP